MAVFRRPDYDHEVREMLRECIDKYRPGLRRQAVRVEVLFIDPPPMNGGKVVLGTAKKISGAAALLATPGVHFSDDCDFFLITITKDYWETFTRRQRIALLHHELMHCEVDDETGRLFTVTHDVEEFLDVLEEHGFWKGDLVELAERTRSPQMQLFYDRDIGAAEEEAGKVTAIDYKEDKVDEVIGSPPVETTVLQKAAILVAREGRASAVLVQRRLAVGFVRARRIMVQLEQEGVIGPENDDGPREVLMTREEAAMWVPVDAEDDEQAGGA